MMTTLLHRHHEQHPQKSRFSQYLHYFRDVGPSYIVTKRTSGLCEHWALRGLGWGEAVFTLYLKYFGHVELPNAQSRPDFLILY